METIKLILRLDDIGRSAQIEIQFIRVALAAGLKLSCGVVPGWLDPALKSAMLDLHSEFPDAIEVHQHGFVHCNYQSHEGMTPYEFGPARSYEQQLSDITRGADILTHAFRNVFTPIFSPPYGEYDDNTLSALLAIGMQGITPLSPDESTGNLLVYPAVIDCHSWNPRAAKDLSALSTEWSECTCATRTVVLHPCFIQEANISPIVSLFSHWALAAQLCLFGDFIRPNFSPAAHFLA